MKVHIGGVMYGYCNIGDDAILESMINSFLDRCRLSVATQNPEWLRKYFPDVEVHKIGIYYTKPKWGINFIGNKNPRKILQSAYNLLRNYDFRLYSKTDLYICGGATILSDYPWYSMQTIKEALKAGTKVVMFGVGMAELEDKSMHSIIRDTCNGIEDIYVRDEFVKERLLKLGVKSNKIKICYDPAIMLDPADTLDYDKVFTAEQKNRYFDSKINIGLCLSGENDVVKRYPYEGIKKLMIELHRRFDANIFLAPTTIKVDKKAMSRLLLKGISTNMLNGRYNARELISIMKNFHLVISSRLHMNILSSIVGTPFIGMVRNTKIVDYAKLFNLPYIELKKFNVAEVLKYVKHIILNQSQIRNMILKKLYFMRDKHQTAVNSIKGKYYRY